MTAFAQDYISQKEFAQKLYSKKICSDKSYQKLLAGINDKKLENPLNFLDYCDKAIVIYLNKYSDKPDEYLQQIHKDVANLLPNLAFTNFKFQIELDNSISDSDEKFYDFVVSLQSNGKTYKQRSTYHLFSVSKNAYFGDKIDQQEFYKIFNKILADLQSPYRLHEVKGYSQVYGRDAVDWDKFGIIALTKEQADMLHSGGVLFLPSWENFKSSLTSKSIQAAISEYQRIGLFSHLSPDQTKTAAEKASQQENLNLNDVIECFPNTVLHFDTELENLQNPYKELLERLSQISKGAFSAIDVVDDFAKPTRSRALVKFVINGKKYAKELQVERDWMDPAFFDLVNQAVIENKLNGQFYELYTGGQDARLIYLTKEQYDYLRANKLLVFADEWQAQEE